jgi:hypothetical protein
VINRLVREEQVVTETRVCQPDQLARSCAREAVMTVRELPARELGALVGLHVRAHASAGQRGGHRREIVLERDRVDDERGRGQVADEHAWDYGMS